MPDLSAGYIGIKAATGGWHGALRRGRRARPEWTCQHVHASPATAKPCAEAELERRTQGERQVFALRRCGPCDAWWPDGDGVPCPACSVPMERVTLVVLERTRLLDPGNGKH